VQTVVLIARTAVVSFEHLIQGARVVWSHVGVPNGIGARPWMNASRVQHAERTSLRARRR
jgi:hypothetical protein